MNGWRSPLFMGWARSFFAVEPEPPTSRGARKMVRDVLVMPLR